MSAQNIVSKGRLGRVSALTIASHGRLRGAVGLLEALGGKVLELVSQISTAITLKSQVRE